IDLAAGRLLAETGIDMATLAADQRYAIHVSRPPAHGDPGEDILARRLLEEFARRDDAEARPRRVVGWQHRVDPTEVVEVTVREDQRHHRLVAKLAVNQL